MYEIIRVEDVSRPRCKRFVGHIEVDTDDKSLIKDEILAATTKIKEMFNCPVHVVRLYVYSKSKLICQSMWVDKTFADAPLPLPLKYNDSIGDIGIVW